MVTKSTKSERTVREIQTRAVVTAFGLEVTPDDWR
jgi:hypothetical protein